MATLQGIFNKATTENKALTYEEFIQLAGDSKFIDLRDGGYVDKNRSRAAGAGDYEGLLDNPGDVGGFLNKI